MSSKNAAPPKSRSAAPRDGPKPPERRPARTPPSAFLFCSSLVKQPTSGRPKAPKDANAPEPKPRLGRSRTGGPTVRKAPTPPRETRRRRRWTLSRTPPRPCQCLPDRNSIDARRRPRRRAARPTQTQMSPQAERPCKGARGRDVRRGPPHDLTMPDGTASMRMAAISASSKPNRRPIRQIRSSSNSCKRPSADPTA